MEIFVRPKRVVLFLVTIALSLTLAHISGLVARFGFHHEVVFGLVPMFDLNREQNVPTLYATLSLLLCSGLLGLKAAVTRKSDGRWHRHWAGLAILLLAAAVDEQFVLHERTMTPLRRAFGLSGFLYFAWVVPYGLLLLAIAAVYVRFFSALAGATRRRFLISAALYLTGAVGLEMIGAARYQGIGTAPDLVYEVVATVEEVLEMAGVIVFVHALLAELSAADPRIRFGAAPAEKVCNYGSGGNP